MLHGLILLPMGALARCSHSSFSCSFRSAVSAWLLRARSARGDFKYGESARVSAEVSIPNRDYMFMAGRHKGGHDGLT